MAYQLSKHALDYVGATEQEAIDLLKTLCAIPAPSHKEHKRAEFCKKWLEEAGARGVYIDEALNVVYPVNAEGSDRLTLFTAHMDTVFPDLTPMPMEEKDGVLHCPGVGDDTAGVVMLLLTARYIAQNNIKPKDGFLMVCNSCEEANGNLKGARQLMKDYAGRVKAAYIMDGLYNQVVNWPVAYLKYKVNITAEGGHAYLNFGNKSAIVCAADFIKALYATPLPEGCKSSYNVGMISGGTSINAIAQNVEMLVEMRSELNKNLDHLDGCFHKIIDKYKAAGWGIEAEPLGRLPGKGDVDPQAQKKIDQKLRELLIQWCGSEPIFRSGTGDLNIPMSMGVPGVGWAAYKVTGVHTREERVELGTLKNGLAVALSVVLSCVDED